MPALSSTATLLRVIRGFSRAAVAVAVAVCAVGAVEGDSAEGIQQSMDATQQQQPSLRDLQEADTPRPLPIAEAFPYQVRVIDENHLRITWQPAPEHYLYQHRFDFRLKSEPSHQNESSRYIESPRQSESPPQPDVRFILPPGLPKTDQFFGDVTVYYAPLSIDLFLPPHHKANTLLLHYQGCTDWGFCYPPQQDEYALANSE